MLVQALEGAQSPGAVDRGGDVVLGVISAGKGGTASVPSDAFSFFFVRRRKNGTEPVPPGKPIQMRLCKASGSIEACWPVRPSPIKPLWTKVGRIR
jgi:hypothetical protein